MTDKPTRPIEMGICLEGGHWTTEVVDIPADTPEDKVEEVARATIRNIEVVGSWVYNSMDDDCPEVEKDKADLPKRWNTEVMLWFDLDQVVLGSKETQASAAIELVNLVLEREPHGLGAKLEPMY